MDVLPTCIIMLPIGNNIFVNIHVDAIYLYTLIICLLRVAGSRNYNQR